MVSKTHSRKADQLAKPGNAAMHGQCMSVAIITGAIKWNRPIASVAFWSVFQNPVTYGIIIDINQFKKSPSSWDIFCV